MGNPYLQMASTLMAMIDGIQNKYPATWTSAVGTDPQHRLSHAIACSESGLVEGRLLQDALREDRDFLLAGDVFSESLLDLLSQYLPSNSSARTEHSA
jgi:glutamine synthetase